MKVSVCIPTYNQALYIEQTIRSCTKQTFLPFEIIVSDDCSSDNTLEVLEGLAKEFSYLKIVRQAVNIGMVPNTDAVLRMATGEFIVKLDSDDYLAPTYIQKLGQLLQLHAAAGYAHGAVQEIDGKGIYKKQRLLARKTGFYNSDVGLKNAIYGYQVAANIIMFRRTALETVGFITAKTNFAEDYYLSAELAAAGFGNVFFNEILSYYRVWVDTGKVRQKRKLTEIDGIRRVFDDVLTPAFKQRGWSLITIEKSKTNFACIQADCLSWKVYNKDEKTQLVTELEKLSAAPKARFTASMYLHGFGKLLNGYSLVTALPKKITKKILMGFKS